MLRPFIVAAFVAGAGGVAFAQANPPPPSQVKPPQLTPPPSQVKPPVLLPAKPSNKPSTRPPIKPPHVPSSMNEAATGMIGEWELSDAGHTKRCTVSFKAAAAPGGYRLAFGPDCVALFPLVEKVTAWTYPDNDLLYLLDADGKAEVEFSEVEDGMFEAPTPGVGVLFLQNPDAAARPPDDNEPPPGADDGG